jgi:hypothetical protein
VNADAGVIVEVDVNVNAGVDVDVDVIDARAVTVSRANCHNR